MDIDAQILAAEQTIQTLMTQKQATMKTELNQWHDPITRKLPNEIISIIFQFCVQDTWDPDTGFYTECIFEMGELFKPESCGPLFLGWVCRAWRSVAWAMPCLWADIHIVLGRSQSNRDYPSVASEWLDRSGKRPLSIHLVHEEFVAFCANDSSSDNHDFNDVGPLETDILLIALVNQHLDRVENLDVQVPCGIIKLLGTGPSGAAGIRRLSMEEVQDGVLFSNTPGPKPCPSHVWMKNCFLPAMDMQWNQVTHLSTTDVLLEECIAVLQSLPLLVCCSWTDIAEGFEEITALRQPIVCHALQSFLLETCPRQQVSISKLTIFFDSFTFPHLTSYSFDVWGDEMPWDAVLRHIVRSACPLTFLSIMGSRIEFENLVALVQEVPQLIELTLGRLRSPQGTDLRFFRLLAETSTLYQSDTANGRHPKNFLPNLRFFMYRRARQQHILADREREDEFWDCLSGIFGPVCDIHDPKRRPLESLDLRWTARKYPIDECDKHGISIPKSALEQFLKLAAAGVDLDMTDMLSRYDLMKLSMDYHGIGLDT